MKKKAAASNEENSQALPVSNPDVEMARDRLIVKAGLITAAIIAFAYLASDGHPWFASAMFLIVMLLA